MSVSPLYSKQVAVVIPARLDSVRLPGKLLLKLIDKPVLKHVFDRCTKCKLINQVWIATDSEKIFSLAKEFTDRVILSKKKHPSGTSRIAEAAKHINADYLINVQGDEVFIDPKLIDKLAVSLVEGKLNAVSAAFLSSDLKIINSINTAKVIVDKDMNGIYFSRLPVPYQLIKKDTEKPTSHWIHIGIYGYHRDFLQKYITWPASPLEKLESLEQLRIIYHCAKIKIIPHAQSMKLSIDTKKDFLAAKKLLTTH